MEKPSGIAVDCCVLAKKTGGRVANGFAVPSDGAIGRVEDATVSLAVYSDIPSYRPINAIQKLHNYL